MPPLPWRRRDPRTALCALCRESLRADDDLVIIPDFLADDRDPFWRFSDSIMHRVCFLLWDRRRDFIARFNRAVRGWVVDGQYQHMTSEGVIVVRRET